MLVTRRDRPLAQRNALEALAHVTGQRKRFDLLRQFRLFADRQ
jgi:hypothetical protein